MRYEPIYKGMTPPSTQNLKALGLWVFFLICTAVHTLIRDTLTWNLNQEDFR